MSVTVRDKLLGRCPHLSPRSSAPVQLPPHWRGLDRVRITASFQKIARLVLYNKLVQNYVHDTRLELGLHIVHQFALMVLCRPLCTGGRGDWPGGALDQMGRWPGGRLTGGRWRGRLTGRGHMNYLHLGLQWLTSMTLNDIHPSIHPSMFICTK